MTQDVADVAIANTIGIRAIASECAMSVIELNDTEKTEEYLCHPERRSRIAAYFFVRQPWQKNFIGGDAFVMWGDETMSIDFNETTTDELRSWMKAKSPDPSIDMTLVSIMQRQFQ